jgi:hypothetical protein
MWVAWSVPGKEILDASLHLGAVLFVGHGDISVRENAGAYMLHFRKIDDMWWGRLVNVIHQPLGCECRELLV